MYIIENIFNNGFKQNSLVLLSVISTISGILVIISKNPVRSILFLIGLFLTIAVYLFMLNISFIALTYLLVYVGAVSILFLFIIMLINIRVSELSSDRSNSVPLSIMIITIFSLVFSDKSLLYFNNRNITLLFDTNLENKGKVKLTTDSYLNTDNSILDSLFVAKDSNEKVSLVFSPLWESIMAEMSHITSIGNVLYTTYGIGILIVGLILLLSLVGAISVTAMPSNDN